MRTAFIVILLSLLFACENKENKDALITHPFGKAFNSEREKVGLPLLKDYWLRKESVDQVFEEDTNAAQMVFWVPAFVDMNAPYHKYKKVVFQGDTALTEEDVFYFYPEKDKAEVIKIKYDFLNDSLAWTAHHMIFDGRWSSGEITKNEAEVVLKNWGL